MKREERQQKIEMILSKVKNRQVSGNGIDIDLWLAAEQGKPGEPAFEDWLVCCTECVDDYELATGKKDRDSVFAKYVREYGRRERKTNK